MLQKLKDATIPSLYSSAASLGLYYVMVDSNMTMQIPFANMSLPVWGAIGAASFIGAELGNLATEFVAPKIPVIENFESIEKVVVPASLSGLGTYIVMRTLISAETDLKQSFLIGAGGSLVGGALYNY